MLRMAMLTFGVLMLSGLFTRGSTIKSYQELSSVQASALQASEDRMANLDRALQKLDQDFARHRASEADYAAQCQKIERDIFDEASFQNALLTKTTTRTGKTEAVLRTVGKVAIAIPVAIVEGLGQSHTTISP